MPQGVGHKAGWTGSCSRSVLGVSLSLLAIVLFAPASAQAGCGDHVTAIHPNPTALGDPIPPPIQPPEKHVPCTGPNCERSPVAPAPLPVAPVLSAAPEWACVWATVPTPPRSSTPYTSEDRRERPYSAAASIYHPPR